MVGRLWKFPLGDKQNAHFHGANREKLSGFFLQKISPPSNLISASSMDPKITKGSSRNTVGFGPRWSRHVDSLRLRLPWGILSKCLPPPTKPGHGNSCDQTAVMGNTRKFLYHGKSKCANKGFSLLCIQWTSLVIFASNLKPHFNL